ncbi:hypothetical protein INT48_005758, partial [Thamnidium elegans]
YRENIEREAEASAAMFRSKQMLLTKHMSFHPKNTVKAYDRRQLEWKRAGSDERLAYFLGDNVLKKSKKDGKSLGKESIQQYVKAVIDPHNQHRRNNSSIPYIKVRGPLVRAFIDTYSKKKVQEKRDCTENRSDATLGDGYDEEDYQRIGEYFFERKYNVISCGDRLCFVLSHSILGRSQTTLGIQFADLYSMKMPQVGVTPIISLVITNNFSKSNQYGALAFSLFSRFRFENEPFPDFSCRQNWYKASLFPSNGGVFKPIDYKLISLAGRWVDNRRMGNYNASLPMQAMKDLAGFDPDSKHDYFLPRGEVLPYEGL